MTIFYVFIIENAGKVRLSSGMNMSFFAAAVSSTTKKRIHIHPTLLQISHLYWLLITSRSSSSDFSYSNLWLLPSLTTPALSSDFSSTFYTGFLIFSHLSHLKSMALIEGRRFATSCMQGSEDDPTSTNWDTGKASKSEIGSIRFGGVIILLVGCTMERIFSAAIIEEGSGLSCLDIWSGHESRHQSL